MTFHVDVRFAPAGASYTYEWDFNDGESASGATVTHAYKLSGVMRPRVIVRGAGGSTATCASAARAPRPSR